MSIEIKSSRQVPCSNLSLVLTLRDSTASHFALRLGPCRVCDLPGGRRRHQQGRSQRAPLLGWCVGAQQAMEGERAAGGETGTHQQNPTGNEDVTRIRNCETLRNGCESLRRHHWAVCEAARNRRESAAKPAKAPRNPRKRRESAAKKLRIRVTSSLPVGL